MRYDNVRQNSHLFRKQQMDLKNIRSKQQEVCLKIIALFSRVKGVLRVTFWGTVLPDALKHPKNACKAHKYHCSITKHLKTTNIANIIKVQKDVKKGCGNSVLQGHLKLTQPSYAYKDLHCVFYNFIHMYTYKRIYP